MTKYGGKKSVKKKFKKSEEKECRMMQHFTRFDDPESRMVRALSETRQEKNRNAKRLNVPDVVVVVGNYGEIAHVFSSIPIQIAVVDVGVAQDILDEYETIDEELAEMCMEFADEPSTLTVDPTFSIENVKKNPRDYLEEPYGLKVGVEVGAVESPVDSTRKNDEPEQITPKLVDTRTVVHDEVQDL